MNVVKFNTRFRAFIILFVCFIRAFIRGSARGTIHKTPGVVAVAFFTSNLGDMVCATPLLRAIKRAYPATRLIVLGTPKNQELLTGNADIDRYLPVTSFWTALRALACERPECGIAVNASVSEVGLLYLSGARVVTSFMHARVGAAMRLLARLIVTVPYESGRYVPRENLRLLEPCGIASEDTTKVLEISDASRRAVSAELAAPGAPLVVIAPGAGQPYRIWPPERFAALARHIHERTGAMIAVIGMRGEEATESFLASAGDLPVFDARQPSIDRLKAIISLAAMVIANDSGALYVAEAFGTPTLAIAGIADPTEHLPRGPHDRAVLPHVGGPLVHAAVSDPASVDLRDAHHRLASITVEDVSAAFDELWSDTFASRAILPSYP